MKNACFLGKLSGMLMILLVVIKLSAFDWQSYLKKYPELRRLGIEKWDEAFKHYLTYGIYEGKVSADRNPPASNFDWQYYVKHNNLLFHTESEAIRHYKQIGALLQLPCCKSYTFLVVLHLYNLELMDEFIEHINYFMSLNPLNRFHIMITIPVDTNIKKFFGVSTYQHKMEQFLKDDPLPVACRIHDSFGLKTSSNAKQLDAVARCFLQGLHCSAEDVQFLLAPNRGRDIGGFFLQLDQIFKQDLQYDYLVKIHSKTSSYSHQLWRTLNTSFLRIHIHPLLRDYDCIYSNRMPYNLYDKYMQYQASHTLPPKDCNFINICKLLEFFNVPPRNFSFCAGTMFIVPKRFADFFKQYDPMDLFYMLHDEKSFNNALDGSIEHAFERFFGYLIDYLGLKTYCLDYQPLP